MNEGDEDKIHFVLYNTKKIYNMPILKRECNGNYNNVVRDTFAYVS